VRSLQRRISHVRAVPPKSPVRSSKIESINVQTTASIIDRVVSFSIVHSFFYYWILATSSRLGYGISNNPMKL
jgi:hypothetical protein